jgi:hypothetical protein
MTSWGVITTVTDAARALHTLERALPAAEGKPSTTEGDAASDAAADNAAAFAGEDVAR